MSWGRSKQRGLPRRRRYSADREEILMVNARVNTTRKDRLQKIGAIVLFVAAMGGVAYAAATGFEALHQWLFVQNDTYIIKNLDLKSNGRLQASHIREYGHLAEGANLYSIDLEAIRKDLESVPLVKTVEVKRQLPDTLIVRITERTAIARIKYSDRLYLAVDREGYVLGPTMHSRELPIITGADLRGVAPGSLIEDSSILDALLAVDTCDTTQLGQIINIVSVDTSSPDFLKIQLVGGEKALLSRDRVKLKLEQLAENLQTAAEVGKKIKSIDLTVDNNFPVQTEEGI